MQRLAFLIMLAYAAAPLAVAQQPADEAMHTGPIKDVTCHVLWLIESDDVHRIAYSGPAREALTTAGFGRLVPAGAAITALTIGQRATVAGTSRYGQMSVSASILNTTQAEELQIKLQLHTKNKTPLLIDTTMRVPLAHWFLVGAAESRVGLPTYADDGKRGVVIMKIDDGVLLLD